MVADWSLVLRDSGLVLLILHRHHDCHTCNIYIVTQMAQGVNITWLLVRCPLLVRSSVLKIKIMTMRQY